MENTIGVTVNAFGGCSISVYDLSNPERKITISEEDGRTKKLWTLIEYLIFSGRDSVSAMDLIELLWSEQSAPDDPIAALRLIVHRARTELNRLELCRGSDLLKLKSSAYSWNRLVPMEVDTERFVDLYKRSGTGSLSERLDYLLQAFDLYEGRFLPHTNHMHWAMTLDAYYHACFLKTCERAIEILQTLGRHEEIFRLCKKALTIDPFAENLHTCLFEAMYSLGMDHDAKEYYKHITKLYMDEFGILPSENMESVYKKLSSRLNVQSTDIGHIRESLVAEDSPGALFLEYKIFQQICQLKLRECKRSGQALQLALITRISKDSVKKQRASAPELMDAAICASLRQGDLYTKVDIDRYLVLLQSTTYENGIMILNRIGERFRSDKDTSELEYTLLPFTPQSLSLETEAFRR